MKAFTLVELMVSLAIFGLILSGMFGILRMANISYDSTFGSLGLVQEVRQAMDGMTKEIRQSSFNQASVTNSGARIDFFIPASNNVISYYILNNQLVRTHSGALKVLSNHINQIQFTPTASTLTISITASKTTIGNRVLPYSAVEKIRWRN